MKLLVCMFAIASLMCSCGGDDDKKAETPPPEPPELQSGLKVEVSDVFTNPIYARAGVNVEFAAYVFNNETTKQKVNVALALQSQMGVVGGELSKEVQIEPGAKSIVKWTVKAASAGKFIYEIKIDNAQKFSLKRFNLEFRQARTVTPKDYVPTPVPVATDGYMVGSFRCPLWYSAPHALPPAWTWVDKEWADRMPILGKYNENNLEVIDWEIKYAVEHGISFFMDCWFRDKNNMGQSPAKGWLEHWVTRLQQARYKDMIKFAILWENSNPSGSGINSEADFTDNLVPYWIDNFFKKDNYLKFDGKPVFVVYNHEVFLKELGGDKAAAARALATMRSKVAEAGFPGVFLLTVHNVQYTDLSFLKEMGFDAVTAYNVPTFTGLQTSTTSQFTIVANELECWNKLREVTGLTTWPTASMGYDSRPWTGGPQGWVLDPEYYETVCRNAKAFADVPSNIIAGPKVIMLDNWNEYAEGHYLAPTRKYGFGHLDVLRQVFATTNPAHEDLSPEDVGRGPYEYPIGE